MGIYTGAQLLEVDAASLAKRMQLDNPDPSEALARPSAGGDPAGTETASSSHEGKATPVGIENLFAKDELIPGMDEPRRERLDKLLHKLIDGGSAPRGGQKAAATTGGSGGGSGAGG